MAEPTPTDNCQEVTERQQSHVWREWTQVLEEYKKAQAEQAARLDTLFSLVQAVGLHNANALPSTPKPASINREEPHSPKGANPPKREEDGVGNTRFYRYYHDHTVCGLRAGTVQFMPKIPAEGLNAIEGRHQPSTTSSSEIVSACFAEIKVIKPKVDFEWSYEGSSRVGSCYYLPNFIPSWELKSDPEDPEISYHIDDTSHVQPFQFNMNAAENRPSIGMAVPYTHVPAIIPNGIPFSKAPIDWEAARSSLGDLFSVPPDGRIPLAFNKTRLRKMKEHGVLDVYLDRFSTMKSVFRQSFIHFDVLDIDNFGGVAGYSHRARLLGASRKVELPPHAAASSSALAYEFHTLTIPPVIVPVLPMKTQEKDPTYPLYPELLPRPWCRLISLVGASQLMVEETSPGDRRYTSPHSPHVAPPEDWGSRAKRQWKIIRTIRQEHVPVHPAATEIASMFFGQIDSTQLDVMLLVMDAVNWHLLCHQHQPQPFPNFEYGSRPIHFTWHLLVEPRWRMPSSHWPLGEFYLDKTFQLQKQAFTIVYIPALDWDGHHDRSPPDPSEFGEQKDETDYHSHVWTILALHPPAQPDQWAEPHILERVSPKTVAILDILEHGLQLASEAHRAMADAFDKEFGSESLVTDPDSHDKLLIDDDNFSRSRKYFWSVNFLETAMAQIDQTEQEIDMFLKTMEKKIRSSWISGRTLHLHVKSREECEKIADAQVETLKKCVNELQVIRSRFDTTRKRVLVLRDGLFNASSVNESRASTRLGQNVKLLTYVSIFYLPLSFCVALWSINENYSRPPLIITTVLVGFATYFLVANMHNIDVMRRTFVYDFVGRKVLQKMRGQGKGTKWEERAGELRGFRVEERTGGTSKWMVLRFWGGSGWTYVKGLFSKRGKKVETADSEQGVPATR